MDRCAWTVRRRRQVNLTDRPVWRCAIDVEERFAYPAASSRFANEDTLIARSAATPTGLDAKKELRKRCKPTLMPIRHGGGDPA